MNNGTLTITQNGTSKGTFTANSSTSPTIALTDTTYSAGPGLTLSNTTFSETFPIYYARPNETSATATLTATISNFPSAYADGIMIALRMPFNNSASSTLNVNGIGAKPVYYANNTTTATRWGPSGCVALLVYETTTASTGCWKAVYSWDSGNTDTKVRQTLQTGDADRPLLMSYQTNTNTTSNVDNVTYRNNSIFGNPASGKITSVKYQATSTDADAITGNLTGNVVGNVTGNCSGSAGSVAWANVTGKPTIPTVNNATLTIQKNGTNVQTFTANQSTNATANITVPTKLSDLTNDVVNNATLTIQKNGTNVQTFTANASSDVTANITVPTKTSELTNDSGFLITHQTIKQDGVTGATANRYANCTTGATTVAKTATITTGTFTLEAGARVTVKFANKNTANSPTLNINSTGAKNIFHNGAQITSGTNKGMLYGACDFVYDGTQWLLIGNYVDSNSGGTVTKTGSSSANQVALWNGTNNVLKAVAQSTLSVGKASALVGKINLNGYVFTRESTTDSTVAGYPYKYYTPLGVWDDTMVPMVTFEQSELLKGCWASIANMESPNHLVLYSNMDLGDTIYTLAGRVVLM